MPLREIDPIVILDESIKDIKDGLWTCNTLVEEKEFKPGEKPMGCAAGLVGINAGAAQITEDTIHTPDGPLTVCYAHLDEPAADWGPGAKAALEALAETVRMPKSRVEECRNKAREYALGSGEDPEFAELYEVVFRYNDTKGKQVQGYTYSKEHNLSKSAALNWFKRARQYLINKQNGGNNAV